MHPTEAGFVNVRSIYEGAIAALSTAAPNMKIGAKDHASNRKFINKAVTNYLALNPKTPSLVDRPDPRGMPTTFDTYLLWEDVLKILQQVQSQGFSAIVQSVVRRSVHSFFAKVLSHR